MVSQITTKFSQKENKSLVSSKKEFNKEFNVYLHFFKKKRINYKVLKDNKFT